MTSRKPVAVVVGAGPGNGAALCRRFVDAGYQVAALARKQETLDALRAQLTDVRTYLCDAADPASLERTFAAIRTGIGEVDTLLYNAGSGLFDDFENTSAEQLEQAWRINALGAFVSARIVTPAMKSAGRGNIVFIGATASRRGGAKTAAFAAAKAAQRSLAETLARTFWPAGIHVALIVIDGKIATPAGGDDDRLIKASAIAEVAYQLCQQDRSAWSFEVEARPFLERW